MSNIELATAVQLSASSLLFEEGFEVPSVVDPSGYDDGIVPSRWLRANDGFGASRIGLNNGDTSGDWVTDGADVQGLDPNYTNSGACTKEGEVGTINVNSVTYRLTITVAYDKALSAKPYGDASGAYEVMLCALESGFDRQDWNVGAAAFDARALVKLQGSVANDDTIHTFVGEYTTDPVNDIMRKGYDLAVGVDGATSHAIITSVKVELFPGARRVNWSPDQVATAAWYDAADPSTIVDTTTPGQVEQWNDKSGNARHVLQGVGADRPITGTRNINGLNTLDFDGINHHLKTSANATWLNGGPYSIFAVTQCDDTSNVRLFVGSNRSGAFTDTALSFGYASGNNSYHDHYSDVGTIPVIRTTNAEVLAGSYTDPGCQLWRNGTSEGTDTTPANDLNTSDPLSIGSGWNVNNNLWDGLIGEVIIVTGVVSTETRKRIEGYLAHKWGLTANLPDDHPYKDAAPTVLWTPADINTVTWHDAASPSTVDEGTTLTWLDKSGGGHHATQANTGDKPTYDSVEKKFTFDGGDILKVGDNLVKTDPYAGLQNFAVVTVGSWGSDNENNNAFASWAAMGPGATGDGWSLRQRLGFCLTLRPSINDSGSTVNPSFATDFIGVGMRDPSNDIYSRIDGTQTHSANNATAISYTGRTNVSAIGGNFKDSNWTTEGFNLTAGSTLKEIVVIENATVADVEKVEGYLAHKWGLQANLPPSHPYKDEPPHV